MFSHVLIGRESGSWLIGKMEVREGGAWGGPLQLSIAKSVEEVEEVRERDGFGAGRRGTGLGQGGSSTALTWCTTTCMCALNTSNPQRVGRCSRHSYSGLCSGCVSLPLH